VLEVFTVGELGGDPHEAPGEQLELAVSPVRLDAQAVVLVLSRARSAELAQDLLSTSQALREHRPDRVARPDLYAATAPSVLRLKFVGELWYTWLCQELDVPKLFWN